MAITRAAIIACLFVAGCGGGDEVTTPAAGSDAALDDGIVSDAVVGDSGGDAVVDATSDADAAPDAGPLAPPKSATAIVAAGASMKSPGYRLLLGSGEGVGADPRMKSTSFVLKNGVVPITQP